MSPSSRQQVTCFIQKYNTDSYFQLIVQLFENNVHCYIFLAVLEQKMATIENAPTYFRSMLLLFGIETALENLIKVVGLEK